MSDCVTSVCVCVCVCVCAHDKCTPVKSISTVYTVEQLTQHQQKQEVGGATFSCILFAILTSLDIDEGVNGPVAFQW